MNSIINLDLIKYEIFFWAVWFALFGLFIRIYNNRVKKSDKLSDEQKKEILKEKFPKKFNLYFDSIVLISILGGLVIGSLIFFWLSGFIIRRIENVIYFNYSESSWFLFAMFFLFFGIFLGTGLIISAISIRNPKFGRFILKKQVSRGYSRKPAYIKDYKSSLAVLIALFLFGVPMLFLALNNYSYVSRDGVTYNSFFSLNEKTLPWDDATKVEITFSTHKDELRIFYFVNFNDGTRINIFKWVSLNEFSQIDAMLRSKGISFDIEPIDDKTMLLIKDKYSADSVKFEMINKIISE